MLEACLPSVAEAAKRARIPTVVTVLDNRSTDQSEEYVRANFPEMEFVKAPDNLLLCSYNAYLAEITEPVVILLNNDIRVARDFVDPLVRKFEEDPLAFMVAPRVMRFDAAAIEAVDTRSGVKWGMFWADARYPGYEAHAMRPARTFSSGFGAVDRKKFVQLGGYDRRFLPGIMEDADLSLRAARAGFRLYYEPASVVYHMGQASFKKAFSNNQRETLAYRNTFLFMWKNYRGLRFWGAHLFFLPLRIVWSILKGRPGFVCGLFQALGRTGRE